VSRAAGGTQPMRSATTASKAYTVNPSKATSMAVGAIIVVRNTSSGASAMAKPPTKADLERSQIRTRRDSPVGTAQQERLAGTILAG